MSPFSDNPGKLAVDCVRTLAPYVPGKPIEELQRELGLTDIIKLASNENPFGASPRALAAMQRAIADTWLYPDGSGHVLKQKLAAKLGVDSTQITLGNGSNDLLVMLAEAFLEPGLEAIYSQYAFAVYPIAVQATGATGVVTPALPADSPMPLGHDLNAMARAITPRTRVVFIANPNNPTGTWVPAAELHAFIAAAPASCARCARRGVFRIHRRPRPAGRHRLAARIPEPRGVAHVLEGLRSRRCARGLRREPSVRRRHAQSRAPGVQRVGGRPRRRVGGAGRHATISPRR